MSEAVWGSYLALTFAVWAPSVAACLLPDPLPDPLPDLLPDPRTFSQTVSQGEIKLLRMESHHISPEFATSKTI